MILLSVKYGKEIGLNFFIEKYLFLLYFNFFLL